LDHRQAALDAPGVAQVLDGVGERISAAMRERRERDADGEDKNRERIEPAYPLGC
jgi:hypothetical protein